MQRDAQLRRLMNASCSPQVSPSAGDEYGFLMNHIVSRVNRASISLGVILSGDVQRAVMFNCTRTHALGQSGHVWCPLAHSFSVMRVV